MKKGQFIFLLLLLWAAACKHKKPSLAGEETVGADDFISSFELIKLPFEISDSGLLDKDQDTLLISYKVFTQFVPDSVLTKNFGKNKKIKIIPLNRTEADNGEIYLFSKASVGENRCSYVICFDKDKRFFASMELLRPDNNKATQQVSGMDRGFTVYKTTTMKKPDGAIVEGKDAYVLNTESRQFMLIMTDALDDQVKEVINPIDTFPAKNKFSADYIKDKMNFLSVRDGAGKDKLQFFIHINKKQDDCNGEIKGQAKMISTNKAIYSQPGELCSLQFTFSSYGVSIKELSACGSKRGLNCSFDGSFSKKKIAKKNIRK